MTTPKRGYYALPLKGAKGVVPKLYQNNRCCSSRLSWCFTYFRTISEQKRKFRQKGIPFEGSEELVQQYCYCMAPMTADILSTTEGRAKMMDGNPVIKDRVQKMDTICLDGVNNGRHFWP